MYTVTKSTFYNGKGLINQEDTIINISESKTEPQNTWRKKWQN